MERLFQMKIVEEHGFFLPRKEPERGKGYVSLNDLFVYIR